MHNAYEKGAQEAFKEVVDMKKGIKGNAKSRQGCKKKQADIF